VGRCAVLIDGAYLDNVLEHDFGKLRVDIGRLGSELAGPMERLRTDYYHCMPHTSEPPTPEEKQRFAAMDSFIFALKKLSRLQVRLGKLQRIGSQFRQKRVDIWMAVDLVHRPISPLEYPVRGKTGTGNQLPTAQLDPVPVLRGLDTRKHLSDDITQDLIEKIRLPSLPKAAPLRP
jgi:hypothetical protein